MHPKREYACRSPLINQLSSVFPAVLLVAFITVSTLASTAANGKIAFTSNRDGNREIYVMNPNGTGQIRLTNNTIVDDHPTWSPDGSRLAFVSEKPTGGRAIFIMNADGTGRTEVTPVTYVDRYSQWPMAIWTDFYSMDWSPDGTRIVFQDNYDLVIVNSDGSGRHAITDSTAYDLEPAWSPDGSKILFSKDPIDDGGLQYGRLSIVNIDGSNNQFLGYGWQYQAYAPRWSPSGTQILYVIEYTDYDPTSVINISHADGSAPELFDGRTDIYEYQYRNKPSWSPDGMKILFDKLVYDTGYPGDLEIYIRNIDGTGLTQLTNTNGWNFNPSWQPLPASTEVSLSGRVTTIGGRGIGNARVTLTDPNGVGRVATTSAFGYFRFNNVSIGQAYTVSVRTKRYQFQPRTVEVNAELANVNFVAQ